MPGFPFNDSTHAKSLLATSAGPIPYWTQPLSFSERYAARGGGSTAMSLVVEGQDAPDFLLFAPGATAVDAPLGGPVKLVRHLPMRAPWTPEASGQYLTDLVSEAVGEFTADPAVDLWPFYEWVRYRATFETLPWDVKADAEVPALSDGTPNELYRYVVRAQRLSARERKVPNYHVETEAYSYEKPNPSPPPPTVTVNVDAQTLPEVGFIIDTATDWFYQWLQVPYRAYPRDKVAELAGKTNSTVFDAVTSSSNPGNSFAAGTLIFHGTATQLEPYRGLDGELYVDPVYHFQHRKRGWNTYPRADGQNPPWRYRKTDPTDPTVRPYGEGEFQDLFKPV